jgi:uncharacterized protein involved in exopolysaccharide biosynthesis
MTKARFLLLSSVLFSQLSYGQAQTRQIATIESRLIELRQTYTDSHPAVRQLQRQLQDLQTQGGAKNAQVSVPNQIAAIELQLAELQRTYTDNYPPIRQLQRQLQALRTTK